ncbi:hypothetical protein C4E44_27310 [Pseudomonas sp. MWU12-2312b]|nr:hypothetical protein C4E44_27310 [Pseudomonas sp. MWU12-2312b]
MERGKPCSCRSGAHISSAIDPTQTPVGASLLAMEVNDEVGCLDERGALTSIASRLAPTGDGG